MKKKILFWSMILLCLCFVFMMEHVDNSHQLNLLERYDASTAYHTSNIESGEKNSSSPIFEDVETSYREDYATHSQEKNYIDEAFQEYESADIVENDSQNNQQEEENARKVKEETILDGNAIISSMPIEKEIEASVEDTIELSVSCKTLLQRLEQVNPNVREVIPMDGIILENSIVELYEGDTAFDVLKRELIKRNIHMEFHYTPIYHSVYIEGINNIYEFDGGELSGWMYQVNGVAPNIASSSFVMKPGDVLKFVYSCDLGNDI